MTDLLAMLVVFTSAMIMVEPRLARVLGLCSVQGLLLMGIVIDQRHGLDRLHSALLLVMLLTFKVVAIPWLLGRAHRQTRSFDTSDSKMNTFMALSLLLVGFFFSISFAGLFELSRGAGPTTLQIAFSLMTIFIGVMTYVLRANWILLMIGFTVFENGTFLLATLLRAQLPLGVEFGTFADAILAIVVGATIQIWAAKSDTSRHAL